MRKLVHVFPGQGSQYVGMGKEWYNSFPEARAVFEEANDTLTFDLTKLIFEGSQEMLTLTENAQPALLTVSVAAYRVYMQEVGIEPAYSAGHSLGEFSALTCAGVIMFPDALRIVRQRGIYMQEAAAEGTGSMCAVIGVSKERIEEECNSASAWNPDQMVVVSNYNSSEQIVISGHQEAVTRAAARLEEQGARVSFLKVSAPFHSPLMKTAAAKFEEELQNYSYHAFKWPVISNVTGLPYDSPDQVIVNLTAQMTAPVKWDLSMHYVHQKGVSVGIELGARNILTNLMKLNVKSVACYPLDKPGQLDIIREDLAVEIVEQRRKDKVNNVVTKCLTTAVCTRNRNWDQTEYERGVLEPYRKIQLLQEKLDAPGETGSPTLSQMKEALDLLKLILDTKKVPATEQKERFQIILRDTHTVSLFPEFTHIGA
ncbi:ACP S-malonyltransferase [Paenibacillus sp. FJAT-26967]|uniref:ACP S-malonyltransferase n=1 Tax=Paenibacillus sp. FJAT-26967 TaxID=1729690 RepID=UPI000838257A|nr:ACP S-malonyltransferase [Paenibacillus sp. FJAT-26967]